MRAELMKLTSAETISLDFLQPLRLERQSCQSFRSTHEPITTHLRSNKMKNKPSPPEVSLVIGHKKISHQMTSLLWIT
ncbi:hypothetical protein CesoFtcFv8_018230 [Champsocephalus esox]|uniref:Uncharacterized protein n=1 Tax=Champsocephalus esox TaxID=159716 RepID=A0AAN8GNW0_9TELE|nr:hypothetical protein CesoFtcFv8_018230 [Champsocephalus esox]